MALCDAAAPRLGTTGIVPQTMILLCFAIPIAMVLITLLFKIYRMYCVTSTESYKMRLAARSTKKRPNTVVSAETQLLNHDYLTTKYIKVRYRLDMTKSHRAPQRKKTWGKWTGLNRAHRLAPCYLHFIQMIYHRQQNWLLHFLRMTLYYPSLEAIAQNCRA